MVSISIPFNFTTDSTCPFRVWSSFNLQILTPQIKHMHVEIREKRLSLGGTEPGSFSTSFSLLCNFRLLVVSLVGFSNLEAVKCALSHGPLSFSFSLSVVLLGSEGSLHEHNKHWNEERNKNEVKDKFGRLRMFVARPCSQACCPKPCLTVPTG